ncbi:MAG: LysR substrate-binding domain-containing protein [Planctomycetota bacterium]
MTDLTLDPSLLPTFLDVLRHGGIGAAARATFLSQPAVTARIRRLEETLGVPLLVRSRAGVTATPAGERLAEYARQVQRILDEAEREVPSADVHLGRLELIASTTIAAYVLPEALARFRQRHPGVAIHVSIGNTDEVIAALRSGAAPLGLVEGHARASGVHLEPWVDDELVPVLGADAPWRPRSAAELSLVPILWREQGSGTRAVVTRALAAAGVRKRPTDLDLVLGTTDAIVGAAAAGLGLAFLSRWVLGPHVAAGRLRTVPALGLSIRRTFHWALPGGRPGGAAGRFLALATASPPS